MSLQKIGFIGLGLIGGSIAKKLHALHPELTMIATHTMQKQLPKLIKNIDHKQYTM